jgi:hypothetical protein
MNAEYSVVRAFKYILPYGLQVQRLFKDSAFGDLFILYLIRGNEDQIHSSVAVQPFVELWPFFSFLIVYTVGRTHWIGDQLVSRPLTAHRTAQTQNKRTQACMP